MAIIQISRIQVRRGKEQQGTGVPRLASGELGWAVDSQRLYIGSGSTQEGAPIEGNVRLLTANDNILDLVDQYYFKGFDDFENRPLVEGVVGRSLQDRLDDFVSAKSFGVVGDNANDDTEALQTAIDSLFGNDLNTTERNILYIPPGTYKISAALTIPPFAHIIGAGIENTVIVCSESSAFKTIGDNQPGNGVDQNTQSRHVKITDMSIICSSPVESAFMLDTCRDSEFRNLKLRGPFILNTSPSNRIGRYAFEFVSVNNTIINQDNVFENITIENFAKGFQSTPRISNNKFNNINLYELEKGIEFVGSAQEGPSGNIIQDSKFEYIEKQGIEIALGEFNTSRSNKFINVGNDGGNIPVFPVIDFKSDTNISVNDYFDRTALASPNNIGAPQPNVEYVPEVAGRTRFENLFAVKTSIGTQLNFVDLIKIPSIGYGTIFIDYVYTVVDQDFVFDVRQGVLEITINNSSAGTNPQPLLVDDYTLLGDINLNSLEFKIRTLNDIIIIQAKNDYSLTSDVFYYTIRSKT